MQNMHVLLFCMVLSIYSNLSKAEQNNSARSSLSNSMYEPTIVKHYTLDLSSYFLRPINFSKEGINHYFKYTYNHEKYPDFLAYNLSHMIQFLIFGHEQHQTELYAKSILKLFLQKIKSCEFINAYSLITAMPQIADALTPYIQKKEASFLQELQTSLKHRLSNIFSNYFSYFQKSPDAFLEALAEQLAKKTNQVQTDQHIQVEHVKKDVVRFLETCINKLIWSPQDGYQAWISVNELANMAEQFLEKKLLNDVDALDDLCWSLIYRFVYYLELFADQISPEVFIQIAQDIYHEKLTLLDISEQEDLITTKKEYLLKKIKQLSPTCIPDTTPYKLYSTHNILQTAHDQDK